VKRKLTAAQRKAQAKRAIRCRYDEEFRKAVHADRKKIEALLEKRRAKWRKKWDGRLALI
jgi:hypothetical protein